MIIHADQKLIKFSHAFAVV